MTPQLNWSTYKCWNLAINYVEICEEEYHYHSFILWRCQVFKTFYIWSGSQAHIPIVVKLNTSYHCCASFVLTCDSGPAWCRPLHCWQSTWSCISSHVKTIRDYSGTPLKAIPISGMFCFTSGEARKSESVGRIVFVNVMYEYYCKNRKRRATAAFSSFSSLVWWSIHSRELVTCFRSCQVQTRCRLLRVQHSLSHTH